MTSSESEKPPAAWARWARRVDGGLLGNRSAAAMADSGLPRGQCNGDDSAGNVIENVNKDKACKSAWMDDGTPPSPTNLQVDVESRASMERGVLVTKWHLESETAAGGCQRGIGLSMSIGKVLRCFLDPRGPRIASKSFSPRRARAGHIESSAPVPTGAR